MKKGFAMRKLFTAAVLSLVIALLLATGGNAVAGNGPGIRVTWKVPSDVPASKVAGYNIYRSDQSMGHYTRLNQRPIQALYYDDRGLTRGDHFFYRVATVFTDGRESKATEPVGMVAGEPGAAEIKLPKIKYITSDALGRVTYLGETSVFVMEGDPGLKASLDIAGAASGLPMSEVKPGTYTCSFTVKPGMAVKNAGATATLQDAYGGKTVITTPATINFYGINRPPKSGFYAGIVESDRIGLNWNARTGFDGSYKIYRDVSPIVGTTGLTPVAPSISGSASAYIDANVEPGKTYYYLLAAVDRSGSETPLSDSLQVRVPEAGMTSGMDVSEDSAGKDLKPGDQVSVTVKTTSGGAAMFSIGSAVRDNKLTEKDPGTYVGTYVIKEGDGVFKSRVAVSFRDASGNTHFGNSATFVSFNAPRLVAPVVSGRKPIAFELNDDIQSVVGISGRLTAGETIDVTLRGEPGNKAFFSIGDGIWKVPMAEDPGTPGTYKGSYTIKPGDSAGMSPDPLKKVYLTAYLQSPAGVLSDPMASPVPVVVDTTCNIKVETSMPSLPADARSQAKVTFTVTDADGKPVRNRRLTILLEPPPNYTGVVGAGGMVMPGQDQSALLGRLRVDFDDLTDSYGQVTATYTSGFAAKTAMITARDFATGSVGIGYITTSITSSVSVKLQPASGPPVSAATKPIYQLTLDVVPDPGNPVRQYPYFLVEAVPNILTADGVSRANIIATLTTTTGQPVQGKTIVFAVSGAGGTLTASSATTDMMGRAQVFYVAGTKAGRAMVTATEPTSGVSVDTIITLLADAPAKIYAKAYPDTLPADGVSTSRVVVELADVNNNPTQGIGVRFSLRGGSSMGMIGASYGVTDARGAFDFIYTAGRQTGVATIDILAASPPPSDDDLKAMRMRVVAPMVDDNYDYTELTVLDWYKAAGDQVGQGEPLALVDTPLGSMVVYSPASGVLDRITVDKGVNVIEGKEIGVLK